MLYLECQIPEKKGYVLPIGDLHFGDPSFKEASFGKLKGYIRWVKNNPSSRVVLGGDLFNVATRISVTLPFEETEDMDGAEKKFPFNKELNQVIDLFWPIRRQIVGAIDGNHEYRLIDFANFSIMNELCVRLGIAYMGISGVVNFKVGLKGSKTGGQWQQNYYGFFHHTTGGGQLAGGGLNRVEKLKGIVEGCDFYCGFHNHRTFTQPQECFCPNPNSKKLELKRYWLVGCGGYLEYSGSYAERKMLTPLKLGSPRIRLDGHAGRHDVHVSI
jgi:hypothetical protein